MYRRYILTRTLTLVASVYVSITVVFLIPRLVPGNPLDAVFARLAQMGARVGSEELIEEYKRMFGLDKDLLTQYMSFLNELAKGNLGYSINSFPTTVAELLVRAVPWTVGLLGVTTIISWVLGTLIGAVVGWRGDRSMASRLLVPFALLMYITPYYILAILLLFFFAYYLNLFPSSGGYTVGMELRGLTLDFILDVLHHSVLPALSIVIASLGWWFLSMRSMIITVKGEDFVLMAYAKGLKEKTVMWRYAFRNAILPQTTGLAISLSHIVGGALLTEVIFAYPGIGWLIYTAITSLDYPVIQGSVLLVIVAVALANYFIDLVYPLIDPRIRYGGA